MFVWRNVTIYMLKFNNNVSELYLYECLKW